MGFGKSCEMVERAHSGNLFREESVFREDLKKFSSAENLDEEVQ